MRFSSLAIIALLVIVVLAVGGASILYVAEDWLVAIGVRAGIDAYNAHFDSSLTVQTVSFDLFSRTATLQGITIASRRHTQLGPPVNIEQATARIRIWPLIQRRVVLDEVSVSGASVRLEIDSRRGVNLEALFRPVVDAQPHTPATWDILIRRFEVDRLTVNMVLEDELPRAILEDMAVHGSLILEPFHLQAQLAHGRGEVAYGSGQESLHLRLSQITAGLDLFEKRVTIKHFGVGAEEFKLFALGDIWHSEAAIRFNGELPLATLSPLIPELPHAAGTVAVQGSIDGPLYDPQVRVTVQGEHIEVGAHKVARLHTSVKLAQGGLQIEQFALGLAQGTIQGMGAVAFAQPQMDLEMELADLWLADLLPLAGITIPIFEGHVGGRVRVMGPWYTPGDLRAEGTLVIAPRVSPPGATRVMRPLRFPLSLTTGFRFENRLLALTQTEWALDGAKGQLSGSLSLDGATHVSGSLETDLAASLPMYLGLPAAQGNVALTFGVRGKLAEPQVNAELQLRHVTYQGIPLEQLRVVIEAQHSDVKIVSLSGTQWGGRYQIEGGLKLSAPVSQLHRHPAVFPIQALTALQVQVQGINLAKLTSFLPIPVPLAGEMSLRGTGAGLWPNLRGEGHLDIRGLGVHGEPLGDLSLIAESSSTQVTLKQLLAGVGGGEVQAHGVVTFPRHLAMTMAWRSVHVERLTSLMGLALPLVGQVHGTAQARGSWPDLTAEVSVQGPRLRAQQVDVGDLRLQATVTPHEVRLGQLTTRLAGAHLTATGRVARDGRIEIRVASEPIPLQELTLYPKELPLAGHLQLSLVGSGSIQNPMLRGRMQLTEIQAGGMSIGTGELAVALDGRQAHFSTTGLQGFSLNGSVTLEQALPMQLRLGIRAMDLGSLSAALAGTPGGRIDGDVSGVIEVSGQVLSLPSLTGRITLEHLRLHSNGIEVQNSSPLRWQFAQGILRFESVRLQGQGASLDMRGTVNLLRERLDVTVLGTSPLAAVGTRIPGLRFQQGEVTAQLAIRGSLREPLFEGQAMVQHGALYIAAINEHLSQLTGQVQFVRQTLAIEALRGQLAGGSIGVSGEIRLRGFRLGEINLTAQAHQVRLRYPAGFFALLDAEVVTSGTGERQWVTGEIGVTRARYRQEVDLASLLQQYRQRPVEPPAVTQERLQLDLRVHTRDPMRVENRLAKLQLGVDLNVRGSLNRPVVLGRVDVEKGTASVAGTRFTPVSGSVEFLNPAQTEPFFDITADTQKSGYQIHIAATGTARQLNLNLTSEPSLAEPDILALLSAGATGQAIAAGVSTVLPRHVSSFLTGRLAEEIGQGVGGLVGVDRLEIAPVVGGAQRVGGPKVTVGKDVSKDLSVTYSTVVGSTQDDIVSVEYRLTDSISLLGARNERGGVGVDVKFSLRFE